MVSCFGVTTWHRCKPLTHFQITEGGNTTVVQAFTLCCLQFNLLFVAKGGPGVSNGVADALFCKQVMKLFWLALEADFQPLQMPQECWLLGGRRLPGN